MTLLTKERVVPVAGSVRGIFEHLNALFCVYCESCSSDNWLGTVRTGVEMLDMHLTESRPTQV